MKIGRLARASFGIMAAALLASCGGGGSDGGDGSDAGDDAGGAMSSPPALTIMPTNDDHPDTAEAAGEIVFGEAVEGLINSPEDRDYFRLQLTEPGTVLISLTSPTPGIELSVQDSDGNVLAEGQTSSVAIVPVVVAVGARAVAVGRSILVVVKTCRKYELCRKAAKMAAEDAIDYVLNATLERLLSTDGFVVNDVRINRSGGCLAIVEPRREPWLLNLNDYILNIVERVSLDPLKPGEYVRHDLQFDLMGQIPEGITLNLSRASGRLDVSAPRGAELGRRRFEVKATAVTEPDRTKVFTFTVCVTALPQLKPGQSETLRVITGTRTEIDLRDLIGPPEGVGGEPHLAFRDFHFEMGEVFPTQFVAPYLIVDPPSDLSGEFYFRVSTWFSQGVVISREVGYSELRGSDFRFRVIVEAPDCQYDDGTGNSYRGGCRNGRPHGQGTSIWTNDSQHGTGSYAGAWQDGKFHGQGTLTSDSGVEGAFVYVGEFRDSIFQGQGNLSWANGKHYVGNFQDGVYHGQGTETRPGGIRIAGEWDMGGYWNITEQQGDCVRTFRSGAYVGDNGMCSGVPPA